MSKVIVMDKRLLNIIVKRKAECKTIWVMGKRKPRKVKVYKGLKPLLCWSCKKPIKIGDRVFLKSHGNNRKHYHLSCWEKTFVLV